ncbi:hypothetical protein [Aquabacter spiritensis]|uniref:Oxidoreductase molybdopterin-binding domain-containing protein n=1 Tax=Aquabacter spiritensis TaxID=933073 RepID=A0A4V2UYL2_9HYPH|nr:hypothetical protein [Aquabacter spiritensis]TCT07908.1 hypothetical protein EDC64_101427 [Aquabacter spiritensis]
MRLSLLLIALATALAGPCALAQQVQRAGLLLVSWHTRDGRLLAEQTLDLGALDAMPQVDIVTSTPWTEGAKRFSGPAMARLAGLAGLSPVSVRVTAMNDYVAVIPAADWKDAPIVLATRLDGKVMRVRDKGPFWIMYPIDARPEFLQLNYRARMVWQVKSLDFVVE